MAVFHPDVARGRAQGASIYRLDAVAAFPAVRPGAVLLLAVAVNIQILDGDIADIAMNPDHVDIRQPVLQHQARAAAFAGQPYITAQDVDAAARALRPADAVVASGQVHPPTRLRQGGDGRIDGGMVVRARADKIGLGLQMFRGIGGRNDKSGRAHLLLRVSRQRRLFSGATPAAESADSPPGL